MASKTSERLEKFAPWGILGFTVTFLGVLISLWIFCFQENSAKVRAGWWLRNEEKLVEVRETISDLRILYHGQDMLESGKELRILTLEFVNEGRNITQDMFDQNLDFGLRFASSEIITSQVVRASSQYLGDNLIPRIKMWQSGDGLTSSNNIEKVLALPKLILDRGSAFTVKVYLLHSNPGGPSEISCLGKIAGLESVTVTTTSPVRSAGNNLWMAVVISLCSALLGTAIYAFGLRARAKALESDHVLEALRQELRDVSQHTQSEAKPALSGENALPKPGGELHLPPTT